VEYASKPCGAIFRWCGSVLRAALKLGAERDELNALVDAQAKRVTGLKGELSAVADFEVGLGGEQSGLQSALDKARAGMTSVELLREAAERELAAARAAIGEARAKISAAEAKGAADAEAARRRLEAEEEARKRLQVREEAKKEAQAKAQAEIEADLASRQALNPENPHARLAWLHMPQLEEVRPFEFGANTAALAVDAHTSLGKIGKQLQANPGLRLHIAGHAQADEDPRLSSQRAQAVGAALIALGAAPARLRAKGYGATVPMPPASRAKLRLRSDRRVGVHAIGEVATVDPLHFEASACEVRERVARILEDVALMLEEDSRLRLSVEGHADEAGEPAENAKLSAQRAQKVCAALHSMGVGPNRLVAHGFGATLPLADNATSEGRAKNRRVQFLVIPDVAPGK